LLLFFLEQTKASESKNCAKVVRILRTRGTRGKRKEEGGKRKVKGMGGVFIIGKVFIDLFFINKANKNKGHLFHYHRVLR